MVKNLPTSAMCKACGFDPWPQEDPHVLVKPLSRNSRGHCNRKPVLCNRVVLVATAENPHSNENPAPPTPNKYRKIVL